ncbi:hypothetical protein TSOC_015225, partial [Tetrabaena socialis]
MAAPSAAEARSALRALLRAVDRHLTPVAGNTQWRRHVLERFRQPPAQQPPSSAAPPPPPAASSASSSAASSSAAARPIAPAGMPPTPAQALAAAREWAALARNIASHKALLLSYNIGLDVDARTKRMVEATARRVGFALPDLPTYDEEGKE